MRKYAASLLRVATFVALVAAATGQLLATSANPQAPAGHSAAPERALLEPFRYSRYAQGKLHPVSNSPYPWS